MAQRHHHYERAFEEFLRSRRIPYVAVDEARKALLPDAGGGQVRAVTALDADSRSSSDPASDAGPQARSLKSFDFVIYSQPNNLLLDVKGRKVTPRHSRPALPSRSAGSSARMAMNQTDGVAQTSLWDAGTSEQAGSAARSGRWFDATGHGGDPAHRHRPPGGGTARVRLESWVTREDIESLTRWERLFGSEFRAAFLFIYWCEAQPPDALFQEVFEYRGCWYALRGVLLDDYRRHMRVRSPRWGTVDVKGETFERISHPFTAWAGVGAGAGACGEHLAAARELS